MDLPSPTNAERSSIREKYPLPSATSHLIDLSSRTYDWPTDLIDFAALNTPDHFVPFSSHAIEWRYISSSILYTYGKVFVLFSFLFYAFCIVSLNRLRAARFELGGHESAETCAGLVQLVKGTAFDDLTPVQHQDLAG